MPESSGHRLHVLTLTPFYPSDTDDAQGCFVAEVLPLLEQRGVSNTVMMAQPFYRGRVHPSQSAIRAAGKSFFAVPGSVGLASAGVFLFAGIVGHVRRIHQGHRIALIHAHSALPCGHAAALLSRELQIPFVVTVHGLDAFSTAQAKGYAGRWCQRLSEWVYRQAGRVICVSEKVRENVLRCVSNAATGVVFNGVDADVFCPADGNRSSVLCVGNLIPSKGQSLLVEAFAKVMNEVPDLWCEIIGDGPEERALKELAMKAGAANRVIFLGRRSRKQVAQAMKDCLLFALPSSYEALGCVYLEAMACGKAVIGCHGQGIDEVIEHGVNGWLIAPGNAQQLADAISELVGNETRRRDLGSAARQTIMRQFTLGHQADSLAEIYGENAS